MELSGSSVERNANHAHQVVDDVAKKAADNAAPAIDRIAQAAHQTVDKVAGAAAPARSPEKSSRTAVANGGFASPCDGVSGGDQPVEPEASVIASIWRTDIPQQAPHRALPGVARARNRDTIQ